MAETATKQNTKKSVKEADEALLASLGYKQEFKRAFTPLEVFGVAFSIIGLLPSIASVLVYSLPNGGGPAMVWGWAVASIFILFVGLSMAELASAAPTSGGVGSITLNFIIALTNSAQAVLLDVCPVVTEVEKPSMLDNANTIGSIAAVASIDWGCATQITAAVNIGTNGTFEATNAVQLLVDTLSPLRSKTRDV
ncbi:hypothetical protein PQX77_022043 [Marasmius sp. AFHP31]|nr:hypothetical protein PQX77_022043 [Marasmius sp. AFHP31]